AGVNSSGDYWNNNGGQGPIMCTVPLPHPIPAWAIAGSTLNVSGPGDSWHAGFTVGFQLPALGNTPAGNYLAYTTTQNMFFDVDSFNGNPCDDSTRNVGYSLPLFEPKDPQAQAAACP